jgi:hypothetical protein
MRLARATMGSRGAGAKIAKAHACFSDAVSGSESLSSTLVAAKLVYCEKIGIPKTTNVSLLDMFKK